MKKIHFFFIIIFFFSCQGKKDAQMELISISYLKGEIETKNPFYCGSIFHLRSKHLKKDTILTDLNKYKEVLRQIQRLRADSASSSNCDVRIECKVILSNKDSIKLCIGNFNCIIKDDQKMIGNDTLVYLIRKYAGYYNYFTKEDLSFFQEIKQFGIPSNYKCLIRMVDPNGPPVSPNKRWLDN
jgi:hypothetical protein